MSGEVLSSAGREPSRRAAPLSPSPTLTIHKTLYTATTPTTTVTISDEHQNHRWIPPSQVLDALHWDSNRDTWALVTANEDGVGGIARGR
ncbi:hypothetical protein [Frankia sp. AgB32]|uniref:hypothetical protein n=1 Tax=Frankia sp. AgB32 TaxID=631119 RepID=UPI00200F7963|nr:hypothetical protein [Frankia sp. AgB32]MCK9897697.1 hypothetical protein [Frankia sp. AgB32]